MKSIATVLISLALIAGCSDKENEAEKTADTAVNAEGASEATLVGNIEAGKAIAESCDGCHGENPTINVDDVPHVQGQHEAYMVATMKAYKAGARGDETMKTVKAGLSEQDIADVSAYYAAQSAEWSGGVDAAVGGNFNPIEEGKKLAATCGACHGADGNSLVAGMPNLTGLHPEYLKLAIGEYRAGMRKSPMMAGAVAALSPADVENLSYFYASQEAKPTPQEPAGDPVAGQALVSACSACHGKEGISGVAETPSLAGQDPSYLETAMKAYADGSRKNEVMAGAVDGLSEADIANLAAFYAVRKPEKPEVRLPKTAVQLAAQCDRCHGAGGVSEDPKTPRIAGQRYDYIIDALHAYQDDKRQSSAMHAMAGPLSDSEIQAVAAYYASR